MRTGALREGDVIAGRYRIRSVLGTGRGLLAIADHAAFDQRVVIRVVSSPGARRQLEREGRALSRLASEHVARVLDMGTLPDGSIYLVRQHLEGRDLASLLSERGALPVRDAVGWILQAAEALAEAHAHGLLHRDLDPSKMFLTERSPGLVAGRPVLKVIDFGAAKPLDEPSPAGPDEATAVVGISPYSSPEMLQRRPLDRRADLWSLGAIAYEMLCGRPPFGTAPIALSQAILRDDPTPLSALNPDVPAELEAAIERALQKDPAARPQSAYELAAAVARLAPPEAAGLLERIYALSTAQARPMTPEEEEVLEISQVEEISSLDDLSEETTGDAENDETRVAPAASIGARGLAPAPTDSAPTARRAPEDARSPAPARAASARRVSQEKTEALGAQFVPSDPLLRAAIEEMRAKPKAKGPVFAGAAAGSSANEATTMLPAQSLAVPKAGAGARALIDETTGLPAFRPPPELAAQRGPVSVSDPTASERSPTSSPWQAAPATQPRAEPEPEAELEAPEPLGRRLAMYAIGGGLAMIVILVLTLVALALTGR